MIRRLILGTTVLLSTCFAFGQNRALAPYNDIPVQFEANTGQTSAPVKFLARGANANIYLTERGAVLSFAGTSVQMSLSHAASQAALTGLDPLPGKVNYLTGTDRARWRTGISTFARVEYTGIYPGIDLIYYGKQGRLEYDFALAPGADPNQIRMRFDGAKPEIGVQGNLVLGKIEFEKPLIYQLNHGRKQAITGGFQMIAGSSEVGFWVGTYDHSLSLIIDPVLLYATYLGGVQDSYITGVAPNSRGELYVTGYTLAANFPTTAGVVLPARAKCAPGDCDQAGGTDAFVSKFSADGRTLLYSTYLGGNNEDAGRAITIDANDNAWVTGYTFSNDFPVTSDALQKLCSPSGVFSFTTNNFNSLRAACEVHPAGENNVYSQNTPDVFVTKLNATGNQLLYSTFLGGSGNDNPVGIGLDTQGNVYVAGSTSSVSKDVYPPGGSVLFPVTSSAFQNANANFYGFIAFVTKFSPDARALLYSTVIGSVNGPCPAGADCGNIATSMAVGTNGLVTIGGYTSWSQLPVTKNALQSTCNPGANGVCPQTGFVATIDTTKSGAASLTYMTYLNGNLPTQSTSMVRGLATDSLGNLYATGPTTAQNFPTTPGTLSPTCTTRGAGNCYSAFISKLAPTGALAWSTYYESKVSCCTVSGTAIAVDAGQNVYVAGQNGGAYDLQQIDPFQAGEKGAEDTFVVVLSPSGSQVLFGSYLGGTLDDVVYSLALDSARNIYLGGSTASPDLSTTAAALQSIPASGYRQGFAAKIAPVLVASTPTIGAAVSASAFGGFQTAAPGSWIEIYGSNLSPVTRQWAGSDFNGPNAPNSLGGVQVQIGGQAAFVDYISPGQVNALIPSTVTPGATTLTLTNAAGTSTSYAITLNPVQPGLLQLQVNGKQYIGGVFPDGQTFALPTGAIANLPSRPVKPGETLIFYGVGFGPVSPNINAGTVVAQQNSLTLPLQIKFGDTPAKLVYQGLAPNFTGLYQFNVVVPSVSDNPATPLTITLGGQAIAQTLVIAVQQ